MEPPHLARCSTLAPLQSIAPASAARHRLRDQALVCLLITPGSVYPAGTRARWLSAHFGLSGRRGERSHICTERGPGQTRMTSAERALSSSSTSCSKRTPTYGGRSSSTFSTRSAAPAPSRGLRSSAKPCWKVSTSSSSATQSSGSWKSPRLSGRSRRPVLVSAWVDCCNGARQFVVLVLFSHDPTPTCSRDSRSQVSTTVSGLRDTDSMPWPTSHSARAG